jgi:hypothetical protein
VLPSRQRMNGTLHLVVAPATEELTARDQEPIVLTCKAIKIDGTLIIFADASSPHMSETAMIEAVCARLCGRSGAGVAASR